ncbi:MAG: hypothetical protein A4E48_00264 [Methanosaeta sp. PtaU1.Bin060]|nr:MAG: hypothetical protein A4E48_00264 [Methanosaeta sp. PtaU1.Bin060]
MRVKVRLKYTGRPTHDVFLYFVDPYLPSKGDVIKYKGGIGIVEEICWEPNAHGMYTPWLILRMEYPEDASAP